MSELGGDAVVVLGMHRSGTSSLTQALSCLGLYLGKDEDLLEAAADNVEGHFEHARLVALDSQWLAYLSQTYYKVTPTPADWANLPRAGAYLKRFSQAFSQAFAGQRLWGWKDPRSSMLVPLYREILRDQGVRAHYAICSRHPMAVANSLARRDGLDLAHSIGLWLRHTITPLRDTIGEARSMVSYGSLLSNPRKALEPVVGMVEGWHPSPEQWEQACASVNPKLNHGQAKDEFPVRVQPICKRTHLLCEAASEDPKGFASGQFDAEIEELYEEMQGWLDLMADPILVGNLNASWTENGKTCARAQMYPCTPSWREWKVEANPDPGSSLSVSFSRNPGYVLLRKVDWVRNGVAEPASILAGPDGLIPGDPRLLHVFGGLDQLRVQSPSSPGVERLDLEFSVEVTPTDAATVTKYLRDELAKAGKRF